MQKVDNHHLILANNFLRNISLDGSHRDTGLRIFNQKGLPEDLWFNRRKKKETGAAETENEDLDVGEKKQVTFEEVGVDVFDSSSPPLLLPPLINSSISGLNPPTITIQPNTPQDPPTNHDYLHSDLSSNPESISPLPEKLRRPSVQRNWSFSKLIQKLCVGFGTSPPSGLAQKFTKRERILRKLSFKNNRAKSDAADRLSINSASASGPVIIPEDGKLNFFLQKVGRYLGNGGGGAEVSDVSESGTNSPSKRRMSSSITASDENMGRNANLTPNTSSSKAELRLLSSLKSFSLRNESSVDMSRTRHSSTSETSGLQPIDLEGQEEVSYSRLLEPYPSSSSSKVKFGDDGESEEDLLSKTYAYGELRNSQQQQVYDPNILEDPEFGPAEHKTTMKFSGYVTTIVDYVDPAELKKELNEKFRDRFPYIAITLSKIRSIKREMGMIAIESELDKSIEAQFYVYFEKLIFKGMINKSNRKLAAGACILLAAKLNDIKGPTLTALIEKMEVTFRISRKELLTYELPVAIALEFSLHLPQWEIFPHYNKLL